MSSALSGRRKLPAAAYIHIPFCISKCHYCDFNSFSGLDDIFGDYTRALIMEIERVSRQHSAASGGLQTVYFGGGTPTALPASGLVEVLASIRNSLGLATEAEVTVEANPGTIDLPGLTELRSGGFNRLSLGVQSLDDDLLSKLGRVHTAAQAVDAYRCARDAGFANVGLDLMFALPGQTLDHWRDTLQSIISLAPEHVSLYELSIEEGTQFARLCAFGELDLPDEETQLAMYEAAIDHLTDAGYEHYEVSNFALPGFRSRHNQVYWRNEPHYGFGAGASSFLDGCRARKLARPKDYIAAIEAGEDAVEYAERLEGRAAIAETILLGLRMLDGVDLRALSEEMEVDIGREFGQEIEMLQRRGLVIFDGGLLRVTHQGLLLLDDVAEELVCV